MRLAVFAHCTVDSIRLDGVTHEQIGGPACYCSITARRLKFDVDLYTRFGGDFPAQYLEEHKIKFSGAKTDTPTTRFAISINDSDRTMRLECACDEIPYHSTDTDGLLVSPVCGEITVETFSRIKDNSGFTMADPQGFLRHTDAQNNVLLKKSDLDLSGVDALKVNPDEGFHLVGCGGDDMLKMLQKRGVRHAILTDKTDVSMLVEDKVYSITLPNKEIHDATGIGDIFCAAFCCTMIRERDFLWALSFAGGAAQAALDSKHIGLLKIPQKNDIETNASYFYNLVKFRTV